MLRHDNQDLDSQLKELREIIYHSEHLWGILSRNREINLPNWYLGAGCITQTVWNWLSGRDALMAHIKDVDIVYFDPSDLSEQTERDREMAIRKAFHDIPLEFDVKNQARVHLWYEKKFGYPIQPYRSVEAAINTWPTTATAIAARIDDRGYKICAPFGLNDLLGMIVRPNKTQITKEIYEAKVSRWIKHWPDLTIIPWNKA
jgi:hypothetical protein